MAPLWSFSQVPQLLPRNSADDQLNAKSSACHNSPPDIVSTPYARTYGKLHLLNLPSEVRDQIWQAMLDEISTARDETGWAQRPSTAFDGLILACRQIHDETSFFWPRTIIQNRRISVFTQPNVNNLTDFKRLVLEIPSDKKYHFFLAAASSLKSLAPVIQDLRIFFVGTDRFQVSLTLKVCGNHRPNGSLLSKKLAIDGQNHSQRQPLFIALRYLSNLHSLVLSNHNYPVLPKMVLEHKHHLRQLQLVADPRTTVHRRHDLKEGSLGPFMIRPLQHGFPPVQVLNISANASLNSLQLAGACTLYLKHLTWTVPDLSLQSAGGIRVNWYQDTANLLYILKSNSSQLRTLRMCFHEAIYEADSAAGTLVPAFRHYLHHLPIETLELHVNSQSPWFGQEILQHLPNSLLRLFVSRELLDEKLMTQDIDGRYMACPSTSNAKSASRFVRELQGVAAEDYVDVGEDKHRNDFISLAGGKLGFIGYEYEPTKPTRFGNSKRRIIDTEETRTWLLSLNGRLLDRERNSHLADLHGAKHIPLRETPSCDFPKSIVQRDSIAEKYGPLWVYAPASIREVEAAAKDLEESTIVDSSHYYFGNEEGAAYVFEKEPCAHPDDIPERLWPDEVAADAEEHWQTDHKPGAQTEATQENEGESNKSKKVGLISRNGWGDERTAHWVRNWTWYSRDNSYVIEEERERFLTERSGQSLQSLKNGQEAGE